MSVYSWMKWGCHNLDTSAYDHADDMVEKYTELLEKLDKHIENYESYKEMVEGYYQNAYFTISNHNAGTYGHWLNFYTGKVHKWKEHKKTFYTKMNDEYELAKTRRDTVSGYKSSWETTRSDEAEKLDEARQRQIEETERYLKSLLGD